MKRFIAAFAAALMLAVGVPGVASAAVDIDQDRGSKRLSWHTPFGGWRIGNLAGLNETSDYVKAIWWAEIPTYYPSGPQKNVLKSTLQNGGWTKCLLDIPYSESPAVDTLEWLAWIDSNCGGAAGTHIIFAGGEVESDSYLLLAAGLTSVVTQITALDDTNFNNGTYWYFNNNSLGFSPVPEIFQWSADVCDTVLMEEWNNIGRTANCGTSAPTPDPLTTTTPTLKRNGISFTPDNFDPTCAYEITTSAGTAKQDPVTGEVNVYGVGSGTSVSVTITDCTGATTTVSGKATAATAPVQTLTKPTVATTADAITCTAGSSTVNPTSIAYTLLVDGVAVSTRFSDGAIAPSLVATTAAQNLYTGATLSKATWSIDPAWVGKSYSCTTTSYADGAVGIANS